MFKARCQFRLILPKSGDFTSELLGNFKSEPTAINNLEHRGLERIRSHGADGFERTVALSVLAANLHRIGLLLQRRERERTRRQKKVRLRAA